MAEGRVKANGGERKSVRQQFQIERERRRVGGWLPFCHRTRRGAPAYTSFWKLYKRTHRRLTDMLERDHMSTKMVCNFSCKMGSGRVGPRCRISYRPLFFNIQSEWIAPVVITRERIYRWARWAGGNNLSAKRVDLEKRVDPMLGFVWIFQL